MIVVASANGKKGIREAVGILRAGGTAVDAVEAAIRVVEDDPDEHGVGYGGYPNLLGQVQLDASIMDGRMLQAGAVGAVQGFRHPISIARKVMETLPHVLLVAGGAERFAEEMGFERGELLSETARTAWEGRLRAHLSPEELQHLEEGDLRRWVHLAADPESPKGTVNFIARDARGDLCTGVSTSGWAWKYPGRIGDSPIIGAGNYADNRFGAAACTGLGEMTLRAGTARSVVLYLSLGVDVFQAGARAMEELNGLPGPYLSHVDLIAVDSEERHCGFTNVEGATYLCMTGEMEEPREIPRTVFRAPKRWGREASPCEESGTG